MSIKDELDQEPEQVEAWRPEAGDELIGEIVSMNERKTDDYPDPYTIITIRQENGDLLAFHAFHTVARNLLSEQRPGPGHEIGIRYLGQEQGKTFSYHNYRIVVNRHSSLKEDEDTAATQEAKEEESIPF